MLDQLRSIPLWLGLCIAPLIYSTKFYEAYLTPKWLVVYSAALLCFCKFFYNLPIINLTKTQKILLLFILISSTLTMLLTYPNISSKALLDRITFLGLVMYGFSLFYHYAYTAHQITIPILIGGCGVVCYGLFMQSPQESLSSTFGNVNMTSEHIGTCIICCLASYQNSNKILRHIYIISSAIFLAYIYFVNSRSAYLALFFSICYLAYVKELPLKKICILLSGPFLSYLWNQTHNLMDLSWVSDSKLNSAYERIEIWKGSVKMIMENPLGVGAEMFDYAFIPYKLQTSFPVSKAIIERSPHNELLRYACEDGLIFTILGIAFFASLIQTRVSSFSPFIKSQPLIISYFIYLFVQSIFQFPLQNPAPFFTTAVMLGYFLCVTERPDAPTIKPKPFFKLNIILGTVVYIYFSTIQGYSSYLIANYPRNYDNTKLACRLNPSNWHTCLYAVQNAFSMGFTHEGQKLALEEIHKRPYNFPILLLLGYSYIKQGDKDSGCFYLKKYDKILSTTKSIKFQCSGFSGDDTRNPRFSRGQLQN